MDKILLYVGKLPVGTDYEVMPEELTSSNVQKVIKENCEDREYVSHRIEVEEFRNGKKTLIMDGRVEVDEVERSHYLMLETKEKQVAKEKWNKKLDA